MDTRAGEIAEAVDRAVERVVLWTRMVANLVQPIPGYDETTMRHRLPKPAPVRIASRK